MCTTCKLVTSVDVGNLRMSDRFLVAIGISVERPRAHRKLIKRGNTKAIVHSQFTADLVNSDPVSASPDNVEVLVDLYISVPVSYTHLTLPTS